MGSGDKTDRFRPIFEPEDIFDRFVKNANASVEEALPPRDDEPTGRVTTEHAKTAVRKPAGIPQAVTAVADAKTMAAALAEKPDVVIDEQAKTSVRRPPGLEPAVTPVQRPKGARRPVGLGPAARRRASEALEPPPQPAAFPPREAARPLGLKPAATAIQDPPSALVEQSLRSSDSVPAAASSSVPTPSAQPSAPPSRKSAGGPSTGRGGPPEWDHEITVRAPYDDEDGTRPDAPIPLATARALDSDVDAEDDDTQDVDAEDVDDEDLYTAPHASPLTTDSGQRIVLLTRVKRPSEMPSPSAPLTVEERVLPAPDSAPLSEKLAGEWESVVAPRGVHTQQIEARLVVPDVEAARKKPTPVVGEGVEDGQMPTRQLDQLLGDMAVLLRYGHAGQVRERLEDLRRTYPEDLLLMRRIAEFLVEHEQRDAALETLFALAGGLFERRNVQGMRQALEQVLVLDPDNTRAFRLLGLLEQRPHDAAGD